MCGGSLPDTDDRSVTMKGDCVMPRDRTFQKPPMRISEIDRKAIVSQSIDWRERLVTVFKESEFHTAGTMVNLRCYIERRAEWDCELADEDIAGETVTRLSELFWDAGQFAPAPTAELEEA